MWMKHKSSNDVLLLAVNRPSTSAAQLVDLPQGGGHDSRLKGATCLGAWLETSPAQHCLDAEGVRLALAQHAYVAAPAGLRILCSVC